MPAQPYMLPSYHANRNTARRRMRRAIRDAIMRK
jgi:hypothetical protein